MKYISQPPLLLNVHMHNPTVNVRSWMDSLLAFFPGLQVHCFILFISCSLNRDIVEFKGSACNIYMLSKCSQHKAIG